MNKNSILYTLIFAFISTFIFVIPLSFANDLTKDRVADNGVIAKASAVLKAFGYKVDPADREGTKTNFSQVKLHALERLSPLGSKTPEYKLLTASQAKDLQMSNPAAYEEVYETLGPDGTPLIGKIFTGMGLWGAIQAVLTFDMNLTEIKGISIIAHQETPGLGARIDEAWYQKMVTGEHYVDDKITMDATPKDRDDHTDGKIDVITGATRTSEGMTAIYNQARIEMVKIVELLKSQEAQS